MRWKIAEGEDYANAVDAYTLALVAEACQMNSVSNCVLELDRNFHYDVKAPKDISYFAHRFITYKPDGITPDLIKMERKSGLPGSRPAAFPPSFFNLVSDGGHDVIRNGFGGKLVRPTADQGVDAVKRFNLLKPHTQPVQEILKKEEDIGKLNKMCKVLQCLPG